MQTQTSPEATVQIEDDRTAISVEALKRAILDNLFYLVGATQEAASDQEFFTAVAFTVRDHILARWFSTWESYKQHDVRVVCYLSAEFLMGPYLANNLLNLQLEGPVRQAVAELGRISIGLCSRSVNLVWEMAGWAGWQPSIWIPWQPRGFLPSNMVFGTSLASSNRKSRTAGKWSSPIIGFDMEIPGKSGGHTKR
jgi:hypothetical protein